MRREPIDVAQRRVYSGCQLSYVLSTPRFHDRELLRKALKLQFDRDTANLQRHLQALA